MKRPGLGPRARAKRQGETKKDYMQRKRAEERFETRGRDGDETQSENSDLESEPETPDGIQVDLQNQRDTPKPPKAKKKRTKEPRNLQQKMLEEQFMAENFDDDPYLTMSGKDDSDFGTDGSLTDVAVDTDVDSQIPVINVNSGESESSLGEEEDDISEEESDDMDDIVQNPLLYPPSQPIPYDRVSQENMDPDLEFFRAVTSVKVRHDVSDAAIDDLIKVIVPFSLL